MRWLVWYVRSLFCKHDWDIEEQVCDKDLYYKNRIRVSVTCNKCGWHRSYWKFL